MNQRTKAMDILPHPQGWTIDEFGDAPRIVSDASSDETERLLAQACAELSAARARIRELENEEASQRARASVAETSLVFSQREAAALLEALDFEPSEQYAIADMANIGKALLDQIATAMPGYCWNDSPVEIVCDLINQRDEVHAVFREAGVWEPDGSKFKTYRHESLNGREMYVREPQDGPPLPGDLSAVRQ